MLQYLEFDQTFFKKPCYRLRPNVSQAEWSQFDQMARREDIFADLKISASDLDTAYCALQRGFRKICTQVELMHPLARVEPVGDVTFHDRLELTENQIRAHADHFRTCRFRQDPAIPTRIATNLYQQWIANSLSGNKRIAALGTNFCSFSDDHGVRRIDLLSVVGRGRGLARQLLKAIAYDARATHIEKIIVTTEVENEAAIKAYRATGFDILSFSSVFHYLQSDQLTNQARKPA
jgi:hypothetical protein